MKLYKQKIVVRVLHVWITKNPKQNNEIISFTCFGRVIFNYDGNTPIST